MSVNDSYTLPLEMVQKTVFKASDFYKKGMTLTDYCANCNNPPYHLVKGKYRCGACKKIFYCSKECQKEHWKFHKVQCGIMKNFQDASFAMFEEWKNGCISVLHKIMRGILICNGPDISRTHYVLIVVDYEKKKVGAPFQIVSYKACSDSGGEVEEFQPGVANVVRMLRATNTAPLNEKTQLAIGIIHCRGLPDYRNKTFIKGLPLVCYNKHSNHEEIEVDKLVSLINFIPKADEMTSSFTSAISAVYGEAGMDMEMDVEVGIMRLNDF